MGLVVSPRTTVMGHPHATLRMTRGEGMESGHFAATRQTGSHSLAAPTSRELISANALGAGSAGTTTSPGGCVPVAEQGTNVPEPILRCSGQNNCQGCRNPAQNATRMGGQGGTHPK